MTWRPPAENLTETAMQRLAEGLSSEDEIEQLMPLFTSAGLEPPPWVLSRAKRIARQWPRGAVRAEPLLRRVAAMLRFDSARHPQAVGVRAIALPHHLEYVAGDLELGIDIERRRERFLLVGQLTGPAVEGAGWARLLAAGEEAAGTPLDLAGYFIFDDIASGDYELRLETAGRSVEVVPFRLEAS